MSRDLIRVTASMMLWGLGEGMFFLFQSLYLEQLGADPQQIGNILGAVVAVMALSYLPAGLLADRFGRRPIIHSAWIIATLATVLLAFAPSLPVFVAGMLVYGMTGYVTVPLNSYITAARGRWSVGRAITLASAGFNLGSVIGPVIGGMIAKSIGLQTNFRIAMVLFVFSTAVILTIRRQPVETAPVGAAQSGLRAMLNGRFLRYLAVMFLVLFGLYMSQPLTPNFLNSQRGVDIERIGVLIAARSAGIVVLSLALGRVNARTGMLASQALMAVFNLLIWRGTGFPSYLAGYSLMGSYMVAKNLAIAQCRSLVQSGNMGAAYGLLEMAMAAAMVLGPPLAGFLYERQPEWIYMVALGMVGVGLLANLAFSPVRSADLQAFEEKESAEWAGS